MAHTHVPTGVHAYRSEGTGDCDDFSIVYTVEEQHGIGLGPC